MYFTIYKITNLLNNKYYIGKHQTNNLNDGYMGSGKLIKAAINKYGIENFKKEILYVFDNEELMNLKEAELVTVSSETYNLCAGGKGGFGYINQIGLNKNLDCDARKKGGKVSSLKLRNNPDYKEIHSKKVSNSLKEKYANGFVNPMQNKKHSDESKSKMRKTKNVGTNNPSYGTIWITNGTENKKIKSIDSIPYGWYKGRKKI